MSAVTFASLSPLCFLASFTPLSHLLLPVSLSLPIWLSLYLLHLPIPTFPRCMCLCLSMCVSAFSTSVETGFIGVMHLSLQLARASPPSLNQWVMKMGSLLTTIFSTHSQMHTNELLNTQKKHSLLVTTKYWDFKPNATNNKLSDASVAKATLSTEGL